MKKLPLPLLVSRFGFRLFSATMLFELAKNTCFKKVDGHISLESISIIFSLAPCNGIQKGALPNVIIILYMKKR